MLLRRVLDGPSHCAPTSQICPRVQPGEFVGDVRVFGPHWAHKSHQASRLERAPTVLHRIPRESWTHTILLPRRPLISWISYWCYCSSYRPRLLCPRVLSGGDANTPLRWSDGPPRRRKPSAHLTSDPDLPAVSTRRTFVRFASILQHAFLLSSILHSISPTLRIAAFGRSAVTRSFVRRHRRYIITYCTIVAVVDAKQDLILQPWTWSMKCSRIKSK